MKHLVMIALVIGFVAVCGNAYSDGADHECNDPNCWYYLFSGIEPIDPDNIVSIGQQADHAADQAEKMKQQEKKVNICEAKLDSYFEGDSRKIPCRCVDECYEIYSSVKTTICPDLEDICDLLEQDESVGEGKPGHLVDTDGKSNYEIAKEKAEQAIELAEKLIDFQEMEKVNICEAKLDDYFEGDAEELPCRCVDECLDNCSYPYSSPSCVYKCELLERSCDITENIDIQIKALQSSKERKPYIHADAPHNQIISERVDSHSVKSNGVDENDDDAEDRERRIGEFFDGVEEASGDLGEGFEETPFHSGDGDDDR